MPYLRPSLSRAEFLPPVTAIVRCGADLESMPDAVESIVAQTYGSLEIVLAADSGVADARALAEKLASMYPERAVRVAASLDAALERTAAPIVAVFEDSMPVVPWAVERLIEGFTEHPHHGVVFSQPVGSGHDDVQVTLDELRQAPREFECVAYVREDLLAAGGLGDELWLRLLENGIRFQRLFDHLATPSVRHAARRPASTSHSADTTAMLDQLRRAVEPLLGAVRANPSSVEAHAALASAFATLDQPVLARRHAEDALELDSTRDDVRRRIPSERPYVVFYPGDENPQGEYAMRPVFDAVRQDGRWDTTLLYRDRRDGHTGRGFPLAHVVVERPPDVLVVFRSWWNDELAVATAAKRAGAQVVMINHGAMFVQADMQEYKRSLYPADVNCVWGWRDLELWRRWNASDRFVVTGNPCHDLLRDFSPEPIARELPARFALLLTPGHGAVDFQRRVLIPSARALNEILPVVVKCHPNEPFKRELASEFPTFTDEAELLHTLIWRSELVISNVTSALMAALRFEKPIFLHNYAEPGYHVDEFRERYQRVFNFKDDASWTAAELDRAARPTLPDYEHFAHKADGGNTARVVEVIAEYVARARVWKG